MAKCKSIQCTECGAEIEINEDIYRQLKKDFATIPATKTKNTNFDSGWETAEIDRKIEKLKGGIDFLKGELKEKYTKILDDLIAEKAAKLKAAEPTKAELKVEPTAAIDMDEMIRLERIKKYKAAIDDVKNDAYYKKRWAEKMAILEKVEKRVEKIVEKEADKVEKLDDEVLETTEDIEEPIGLEKTNRYKIDSNIFFDPRIIQRASDIFIGGVVEYNEEEGISFQDYMSSVTSRINRLLGKAINEIEKEDGDSDNVPEVVIESINNYIYNSGGFILTDNSVDGLVEAITQSPQFDKWQFSIRDRFFAIAPNVTGSTKIKQEGECIIEEGIIEDVRTGDELLYVLDGLGNFGGGDYL